MSDIQRDITLRAVEDLQLVLCNRQSVMPESFYTYTARTTMIHGRTVLYLRERNSLRQLDMEGIMLAWRDNQRVPFGSDGLAVVLVQHLHQVPPSIHELPPFCNFDVCVLNTTTGNNRVFQRERVMEPPPQALVVRFAVFKHDTGVNITPTTTAVPAIPPLQTNNVEESMGR
jgi:hypothetical protein